MAQACWFSNWEFQNLCQAKEGIIHVRQGNKVTQSINQVTTHRYRHQYIHTSNLLVLSQRVNNASRTKQRHFVIDLAYNTRPVQLVD